MSVTTTTKISAKEERKEIADPYNNLTFFFNLQKFQTHIKNKINVLKI